MSPLSLLVILCSFSAVYCQTEGKELMHVPRYIYDTVTKVAAECVKESGISQQVADDFFNIKVTPDTKTKAFIYCFGRKINYVDEDGIINENFISLFNDNELKEKAQSVLEKCNVKRNSKYDTAFESIDCFYKTSPILPIL